ncbi:hypothetical protein [Micromonospora sp. NPDC005413]|uniref:hypothetical protein n=1 Tax=Micromonospora sp. NPDC005413 TaxID=3154563 RepID=UPI0033A8D922
MSPGRDRILSRGSVVACCLAAVLLSPLALGGCGKDRIPDPKPMTSPTASVGPNPGAIATRLEQGPAAEQGYWYDIRLSGFPPSSDITVVCRDSITPDGFKTATLTVNDTGAAESKSFCYSGEGEEHWFTADGHDSNRVRWAARSVPLQAGNVSVVQGSAAAFGYWYSVTLRGFTANTDVTVVCRDSADPGGFKTLTLHTDGGGAASNQRACYSGDGAEHWVTANNVTSNRVRWAKAKTSPQPAGNVRVSQGTAAASGYWYVVTLSRFARKTQVTVVCRDSADPGGFKTFTMRTDSSGAASTKQACYSGEGAEHWVTANNVTSNRVRWTKSAGQANLTKGAAAPAGYWYVVALSRFPANSQVTVVCRDSADTGGFKTFTMRTDSSGAASTRQACYSGDAGEHWVTANGSLSNRVTW